MWWMVISLALAGAPARCPRLSEHSRRVPELHAKDWASLVAAWKRAFARGHPHLSPPELPEDPARLRSQACLPRAPDGRLLTDPREVERLGAAPGCPGEGPWLLALGPEQALTLVARDSERGLVAWPDAIAAPGALLASYRLAAEPTRYLLRAELTRDKPKARVEEQLVESLERSGAMSWVEVREGDVPAKVEVDGPRVTVTAEGCPSAAAKL